MAKKLKVQVASKKKTYHHPNLREALIEAGLSFIKDNPVDNLSLRELARELKVSHAAPYRHFPTKEDLLAELIGLGFNRLNNEFLFELNNTDHDFPELFYRMGLAYVRFFVQNPALARLMFSGYLHEPGKHPNAEACGDSAFGSLESMIARGQRDGFLPEADSLLMAFTIWSSVHGMAALLIDRNFEFCDRGQGEGGSGYSLEQMVRFMSQSLLLGISKKK